jgi:hypothetical protein
MNELTRLFVEHLQQSSALEAVEAWVAELEACDESPEGVKAADFKYMTAIHREFLLFVSQVDLQAAASRLQE